jgi:hypothetical protein
MSTFVDIILLMGVLASVQMAVCQQPVSTDPLAIRSWTLGGKSPNELPNYFLFADRVSDYGAGRNK